MNSIKFKPTLIPSLNKIKSFFLKIKNSKSKNPWKPTQIKTPTETQQPFESEIHQHSKSMYPFSKSKG